MGSPYWQQERPWRPVYKDATDIVRVLDIYRSWYARGLTDVQISANIRAKWAANNPPRPSKKGWK